MKKSCLFFGFIILCSKLFLACASAPQPRPLDLATVTGNIPISSITLLINRNMDVDGMGREFLQSFFTDNINFIEEMLIDRGININNRLFLEEIDNSPNIEFSEMRITSTFIVHRYYWNSPTNFETYIELLLNFIIREDGTMPLEVTVRKRDPDHEPGYATRLTLNLRFEQS